MSESWANGIWDSGRCAICKDSLSNDFPKDFPEDWKWCCCCVCLAEEIVEAGSAEELLFAWNPFEIKVSKIMLDIIYKIERKITMSN